MNCGSMFPLFLFPFVLLLLREPFRDVVGNYVVLVQVQEDMESGVWRLAQPTKRLTSMEYLIGILAKYAAMLKTLHGVCGENSSHPETKSNKMKSKGLISFWRYGNVVT